MATPPAGQTSKGRWALLRRAIVTASTTAPASSAMSIFQFHDPAVPRPTVYASATPEAGYDWVEYMLPGGRSILLHQRRETAHVSLRELAIRDVDNTGNIRTWPSEDIALRYLLRTLPSRTGGPARVLELGAGMCGVAGFALAAACDALASVTITDGNPMCVENLARIVSMNSARLRCPVETTLLQWSRHLPPPDCVFFEAYHDDLLHTLRTLLALDGVATLVQPTRGGSLDRFLAKATAFFTIDVQTMGFDAIVDATRATADARLDPDIHLPVLVTLRHTSDSQHAGRPTR
ncbi:hypothetical protein SPRG_08369 [Saprolegnia parasitica CBS 223.65]|uniref:Calmodulin-lysine N-methyltransferase n=1 Tax=Saprolegnia parasitica (strain CBS 223.65) TaxID=695850 RepID=A0A067C6A6_SAPPC|nr:hypothetical protein SPRG_08369 [Saprolegnia parasitica CBS 223.65]KDO26294.1 hypothetical protein SPRG_08369 [Saprolegnia parasitica CBS 223.65]|eukprot:XP_012202998.1 hypothetical protein SPRG_08369 [Saprolegnia parasitica CBS 223.65]